MQIRPYVATDAPGVIALNQANLPEVGPMDHAKLDGLAADAVLLLVADDDDAGIVGMLIVLDEHASYPSPNYRWFVDRYDSFWYVDRIAVSPETRGQGLAASFYAAAIDAARDAGRRYLCAEVNTIPDNPPSHRFHEKNGFVEVARERPYTPDAEVAMYARDLQTDS